MDEAKIEQLDRDTWREFNREFAKRFLYTPSQVANFHKWADKVDTEDLSKNIIDIFQKWDKEYESTFGNYNEVIKLAYSEIPKIIKQPCAWFQFIKPSLFKNMNDKEFSDSVLLAHPKYKGFYMIPYNEYLSFMMFYC